MDLSLGQTALIRRVCAAHRLTIPQTAYVLATARWETAHTLEPVREAYWLSEAWRKANLRYWPWYGRGFVQLTWEANYRKAGAALGRDFITNPDAVMEPEASAEILVRGMVEGWFTGKRLGDYVNASGSDYRGARQVVNGTDKAAGIAVLAGQYEAALKAAPALPSRPALSPGWLVRILQTIIKMWRKA